MPAGIKQVMEGLAKVIAKRKQVLASPKHIEAIAKKYQLPVEQTKQFIEQDLSLSIKRHKAAKDYVFHKQHYETRWGDAPYSKEKVAAERKMHELHNLATTEPPLRGPVIQKRNEQNLNRLALELEELKTQQRLAPSPDRATRIKQAEDRLDWLEAQAEQTPQAYQPDPMPRHNQLEMGVTQKQAQVEALKQGPLKGAARKPVATLDQAIEEAAKTTSPPPQRVVPDPALEEENLRRQWDNVDGYAAGGLVKQVGKEVLSFAEAQAAKQAKQLEKQALIEQQAKLAEQMEGVVDRQKKVKQYIDFENRRSTELPALVKDKQAEWYFNEGTDRDVMFATLQQRFNLNPDFQRVDLDDYIEALARAQNNQDQYTSLEAQKADIDKILKDFSAAAGIPPAALMAQLEQDPPNQVNTPYQHTGSYGQTSPDLAAQMDQPDFTPQPRKDITPDDRMLAIREGLGSIPGLNAELLGMASYLNPVAAMHDQMLPEASKWNEALPQYFDEAKGAADRAYMSNPGYATPNRQVHPLSTDEKVGFYGSWIADPIGWAGIKGGPAVKGLQPSKVLPRTNAITDPSRRQFMKDTAATAGIASVAGIAGLKMMGESGAKQGIEAVAKRSKLLTFKDWLKAGKPQGDIPDYMNSAHFGKAVTTDNMRPGAQYNNYLRAQHKTRKQFPEADQTIIDRARVDFKMSMGRHEKGLARKSQDAWDVEKRHELNLTPEEATYMKSNDIKNYGMDDTEIIDYHKGWGSSTEQVYADVLANNPQSKLRLKDIERMLQDPTQWIRTPGKVPGHVKTKPIK